MKSLLIALIVILFTCCISESERVANIKSQQKYQMALDEYNLNVNRDSIIIINAIQSNVEMYTKKIDSCEYLVGFSGTYHGGPVLTHKGNCSHCRAYLKKTISELLNK